MYEADEPGDMPSEKLERQLDDVKKDAMAISSLFRESNASEGRPENSAEE